jgi:hypothetical protein
LKLSIFAMKYLHGMTLPPTTTPTPLYLAQAKEGNLGLVIPWFLLLLLHPDLNYCRKNETSILTHVQLVGLQHHLTSVDVYLL